MKLTQYVLTKKAHAKLNLFLEVTGKRDDGYHELYSLVVFLDLADEITVEPAATITVSENIYDSGITNNIIHKTAALLAEKYKVKTGARITFNKNIPIGGGLGGGSSDAATMIVLLDALWDLNLSHDEMYEAALELGADVPVCLYSILENKNAAIFKGAGEIIGRAPKLPKMCFTLVNPGIELSTGKVFKNFQYHGLSYEPMRRKGDFFKNLAAKSNDLQATAIELVPEIAAAIDGLAAAKNCELARMTGSGATSFGVFKTRDDARAAAISLIKHHPNWQIGAVGLKELSAYSAREKLKRKLLKTKVRVLKSVRNSAIAQNISRTLNRCRIKTLRAKSLTFAITAHLLAFFIYDTSFTRPQLFHQPEFISIAFAVETPPAPPAAITESDYEPAAGETAPLEETKPATPVKKSAPAAHKAPVKKLGPKPAFLNGASYGNSNTSGKTATRDYLELLQYNVQEMSEVPAAAKDLKGRAVLRLAFNRQGYVLAWSLKQKTGVKTLDIAAENLAKRLMDSRLPAAPADFDQGDEILQYDFLVSYPPKVKS